MLTCLRSGTNEDCEILYEAFAPILMGIALKIVGDKELAKKVIQKTFILIWKRRAEFNPQNERLLGWFIKSVREVALSEGQKNKLLSLHEINLQQGVYDKVNCENHQSWVLHSIFYQGKSSETVSKELDIPTVALKIMLKKAVSNLNSQPIR